MLSLSAVPSAVLWGAPAAVFLCFCAGSFPPRLACPYSAGCCPLPVCLSALLYCALWTDGHLAGADMIIPVADLDKDFHEGLYQKAKTLYRAEDGGGVDFGNNVFPAVPDIGQVYQAPSVVGALTSVLGDDYVM